MLDSGPAHGAQLVLLPPVNDAVLAEGVPAVGGGGHDVDLHADGALQVDVSKFKQRAWVIITVIYSWASDTTC